MYRNKGGKLQKEKSEEWSICSIEKHDLVVISINTMSRVVEHMHNIVMMGWHIFNTSSWPTQAYSLLQHTQF